MRFHKKTLLWGLAITALFVFGILFLRFVSIHADEFRSLRITQPHCLIIVFIALATAIYIRAGYLRLITLHDGKPLGRLETISLVCSSNLLSIVLIPFASCGANVTYLIVRQRVSAAFVGFAMFAFILFQLSLSFAVILIGMSVAGDWRFISPSQLRMVVIILLLILPIFLAFILRQRIRSLGSPKGTAGHIHGAASLLAKAFLTALICFSIQVVAFTAACASLGLDLNPLEGATLSSSQQVATMISLTPAGIGFQEAITMYVGNLIKMNVVLVFGALLLIRVSIYFVSIVLLLMNLAIRNSSMKFVTAPRMFNSIYHAISSLKN